MAFLGDFGKIFLGGASTADVGSAVGGYFGGPTGATIGRNVGGSISGGVDRVTETLDVTAPTSGIDSNASRTSLSQTSQVQGTTGGGIEIMNRPSTDNAFLGGIGAGGLVGQGLSQLGRSLFRSPGSSVATGLGAGAIIDFFVDAFGNTRKLVITRKMQRDVKKLFMLSGGDFNATAQLYAMATGRSISGEQVVKIITKTFTNQGPYVTKAAVRKTRSTIRKMETLCDLRDKIAPTKRRAPVRRRSATTITQVR